MYKRFKRHARDAGGGAGPGPHEDRDGHGLDSLFEASSRDLGGPQREASSRGTEQGGLASAFPDSDETPGSEGASEPASDGSRSTWVVATPGGGAVRLPSRQQALERRISDRPPCALRPSCRRSPLRLNLGFKLPSPRRSHRDQLAAQLRVASRAGHGGSGSGAAHREEEGRGARGWRGARSVQRVPREEQGNRAGHGGYQHLLIRYCLA